MTRTILVTGLCIVALAGCGKTIVRETVVEKPVVTERVIERPTVALVPPPATNCALGAAAYAPGTMTCQSGYQYRCENGGWTQIPNSIC